MNGRDLALGLVGALALAGAVRRRGGANTEREIFVTPLTGGEVFGHVTTRAGAEAIQRQGFRVGEGKYGTGVYLLSPEEEWGGGLPPTATSAHAFRLRWHEGRTDLRVLRVSLPAGTRLLRVVASPGEATLEAMKVLHGDAKGTERGRAAWKQGREEAVLHADLRAAEIDGVYWVDPVWNADEILVLDPARLSVVREQVQEGSRNERPPEEILEAYSYGKCFWLALALHERHGWPLVAEVETDRADGARWISHAWVEMPDGREFDIYGSQRRVDRFGGVEQRVSPKDAFAIIRETSPLSPKEIRAYVKEANEILDRYFPALGGVQEGSAARIDPTLAYQAWNALPAGVRMDIEVFQAGVLVGKTPALEAQLAHADPAVERAMRPIREAVSALGGVRLYRGEPATVHPVPRAWLSWTDDQRMAQQFAGPKGRVRVREVGPEEIVAVFPHGEAMEWLIREQVQEGSRAKACDLNSVLSKFRRKYSDLYTDSFEGQCDAFAIALAQSLEISEPMYTVIQRTRFGNKKRKKPRVLDENPLAHVALTYNGDTWDGGGSDAEERWAQNWSQPDEDDEDEPSHDAFDSSWLSEEKLRALRQERDDRPPSAEYIAQYKAALRACGIASCVPSGSRSRSTLRTNPALWEAVKAQVTASDTGGRPGQWSARKAQRSVQLYTARGGGYLGPKDPDNALARWTKQDWRTRSGGESLETGERYLPDAAFDLLTPAEVGATTRAKRAGLARGQQFTPQPPRIAQKTKQAREGAANVIAPSGYDQTAMARTGPSAPAQHLRAHAPQLLRGRLLDFGSGRGADAKALRATPYDPHHPDAAVRKRPTGTFDTVLGIYVLNVLPKAERHAALRESAAYVKRGGHLVLAVRPQAEVAATVTGWSRNGDGHQRMGEDGARDRFQRGYTPDQLDREVHAVLGDTFTPVPLPALSGSVVGVWRRA